MDVSIIGKEWASKASTGMGIIIKKSGFSPFLADSSIINH
jgi:hypothetical protein